MYRTAVIGGGVVGGMIAHAISKYEGSLVILEKEHDVAMGQSKANSGIVHAGYDPEPGSLKARLNVRGSQMMEEVCRQLDVKYRRNGTLVVAFNEEDMETLGKLLKRGRENGVEGLEIIDGETVRKMEKNLSEKIIGALYAPTGAVVCPYELTLHSIGNAMDNGAELLTEFEVTEIKIVENDGSRQGVGFYEITASDGRKIQAEFVVNCAGIHSDEIAKLAGGPEFRITPRRGQYLLLDKEAGDLVSATVFRTPTEMGKGVLVSPTVHGNTLLGPSAEDIPDGLDVSTTAEGLSFVLEKSRLTWPGAVIRGAITNFSGIRAHEAGGDFVIGPVKGCENAYETVGIESPGLSSAPAIAEMLGSMIAEEQGLAIDEDTFKKLMQSQRERARAARAKRNIKHGYAGNNGNRNSRYPCSASRVSSFSARGCGGRVKGLCTMNSTVSGIVLI